MFLCMVPDYATPTGGVRVCYDIVEQLIAQGHAAAVWHGSPEVRLDAGAGATPRVSGLQRELRRGDVLLVPEAGGPAHRHLTGRARVVMLNQGHFLTFSGVRFGDTLPGAYPGWDNAVAAVATSEAVRDTLRLVCPADFPVLHVPLALDSGLFRPRAKERVVGLTAGRRELDVAMLDQLLRRSDLLPAGWRIERIAGLTRAETAERMGRMSVFVSTAERDGFSMPAAEAMLCGASVTGFPGGGAAEYLEAAGGTAVADGDITALARRVAELCRRWDEQPAVMVAAGLDGREWVRARYSRPRMREHLDAAAHTLLEVARQPEPVTVTHYAAHAPSTTRAGRTKALWRSTARRTAQIWGAGRRSSDQS